MLVLRKTLNGSRRILLRLFPSGSRRRHLVTAGIFIVTEEGFSSLVRIFVNQYIKRGKDLLSFEDQYQIWLKSNDVTVELKRKMLEEIPRLHYKPKITIVIQVHDADAERLETAIDSVIRQVYPNWELCITDSASSKEHIKRILESCSRRDPRTKVVHLEDYSETASAYNAALSQTGGEYVGFLEQDDELTVDALYEVAKLLNDEPNIDYIYTDEDKRDLKGRRLEPFFKPDWSPDLLFSMNYTGNFSVIRRSLLVKLEGLRLGFEGGQNYDLVLRLTEITNRIGHIPKPLYSKRKTPPPSTILTNARSHTNVVMKKALEEALTRRGIKGQVIDSQSENIHRVKYELDYEPLVSIIIPTRDNVRHLKRCVEDLRLKTQYQNYELIVIDNGSKDPATLEYLRSLPLVVREDSEFNYSKLNNLGATYASGKYLLFLNDDIEVIDASWLKEMVAVAERDDVSIVGPKLLFPDGTVQHAGVVVGIGGIAWHMAYKHNADAPEFFGLPNIARNCSAVTAACMLVKKSVFVRVKGFDEKFRVAVGDVDFCLRVRRDTGTNIVYTPYAVLFHHESATRGFLCPPEDIRLLREKWKELLKKGDPYYNPNLSLELPYRIRIEITPRVFLTFLIEKYLIGKS